MTATVQLLDKYKAARGIATDMAAAESLRVGKAAVSKWRNGGGHPDADSVEAMCVAIGEPVAHWLHLIEAERARTPAARRVWLRLAQAAAAIAIAVGLTGTPLSVQAAGTLSHSPVHPVYYVNFNLILRRLGMMLASLRTLFARRRYLAV